MRIAWKACKHFKIRFHRCPIFWKLRQATSVVQPAPRSGQLRTHLGVLTAGFAPFGGTEEEDEQEEVEEVEIGLLNTPLMVQVTAAKEVPATESLKVRS